MDGMLSGSQALLYILCYRMKALAACRETGGRLRGLPLAQILRSRLNPRRVRGGGREGRVDGMGCCCHDDVISVWGDDVMCE